MVPAIASARALLVVVSVTAPVRSIAALCAATAARHSSSSVSCRRCASLKSGGSLMTLRPVASSPRCSFIALQRAQPLLHNSYAAQHRLPNGENERQKGLTDEGRRRVYL